MDDEDYERVMKYKWFANHHKHTWYTMRGVWRSKLKNNDCILMHRFIMNPKPWEEIDHIDGDGLNNQKCNLRIVTRSQNQMNRRKTKNTDSTSSKFKGVYWDKDNYKWRSEISSEGRRIRLGRFIFEEDAARAYDNKAKELFGKYAKLNFPDIFIP